MSASRATGGRLLGVLRDIQRYGPADVLRRLNLDALIGQPPAAVFLALIEFLCPPGGPLDEGIARQAMLQMIADLGEIGADSFDALSTAQLQEIFTSFVSRSIEMRVINDVGQRAITLPTNTADLEYIQGQLHDFIEGCVRSAFGGMGIAITALSDQQLSQTVDSVYESSFKLIILLSEV